MLETTRSVFDQNNTRKQKAALYWDLENVSSLKPQPILEFVTWLAFIFNLISRKAYHQDWNDQVSRDSHEALLECGVECLYVLSGVKNMADKTLIQRCKDDLKLHPDLKVIILITGDGDFCELVRFLKSQGIKVIVFYHPGNHNPKLIELADESYSVKRIPELVENGLPLSDIHCKISYEEAIACLIKAIKTVLTEGKCPTLSRIGRRMRQIDSRYQGASSIIKSDGKSFGKRFTSFIEAVAADGKIKLQKEEKCQTLLLT